MKLTLIIALLCLIKGIKLEESDDSDESNGDVPEHKFDIQKTTFKTGKRKGDDQAFLQFCAEVLHRDLVLIPVFHSSAHIPTESISLIESTTPNNNEPLYLMLFSETRFAQPHFQSVRPLNPNNRISNYIQQRRNNRQSSSNSNTNIQTTVSRQTLPSLPEEMDFEPLPQSTGICESAQIIEDCVFNLSRVRQRVNESNILTGPRSRFQRK